MLIKKYILIDKEPVVVEDIFLWAAFFESPDRHIAHTHFIDFYVSTIFLAMDHNHYGGRPILYETMIFGKIPFDNYQNRYYTRKQSVKGHKRAVQLVLPYWRKYMAMDFVWELFKVICVAIVLAVFALFLCVIL